MCGRIGLKIECDRIFRTFGSRKSFRIYSDIRKPVRPNIPTQIVIDRQTTDRQTETDKIIYAPPVQVPGQPAGRYMAAVRICARPTSNRKLCDRGRLVVGTLSFSHYTQGWLANSGYRILNIANNLIILYGTGWISCARSVPLTGCLARSRQRHRRHPQAGRLET